MKIPPLSVLTIQTLDAIRHFHGDLIDPAKSEIISAVPARTSAASGAATHNVGRRALPLSTVVCARAQARYSSRIRGSYGPPSVTRRRTESFCPAQSPRYHPQTSLTMLSRPSSLCLLQLKLARTSAIDHAYEPMHDHAVRIRSYQRDHSSYNS